MYFLLDIDGTIANRNSQCLIELLNRKLELGIEEERLRELRYRDFFRLPEVAAYRERVGEQRFEFFVGFIGLSPEHLRACLPIEGAVEGVQRLAGLGEVGYVTVRKFSVQPPHMSEERADYFNRGMRRATREWLAAQGFPDLEDVVFCTTPEEKLMLLAEYAQEVQVPLTLIDDMYEYLLEKAPTLEERVRQSLNSLVTLVAFGAQESMEPRVFHDVIALPDWQQLDKMLGSSVLQEGQASEQL